MQKPIFESPTHTQTIDELLGEYEPHVYSFFLISISMLLTAGVTLASITHFSNLL